MFCIEIVHTFAVLFKKGKFADVAQLVEQLICNQLVGGPNPSIGSSPETTGRKEFFESMIEITRSLVHYYENTRPGGYQSGQMGQTVNLLAQPSEVRILLSPQKVAK